MRTRRVERRSLRHAARSTIAGAMAVSLISPSTMLAQRLSAGDIAAGNGTCLGRRVTEVVQPDQDWNGTAGPDVVVVLGGGGEIMTGLGEDIVCVFADPRQKYGHGAKINTGTENDTVITYGGSNTIDTFDGDDLIYLNGEIESVAGGNGHDHIWGLGATQVSIDGEDGNDLIVGSPGNDFLDGGEGVDMILGAAGDDFINGEGDPDTLAGGFGFDQIDGGPDQDTCIDSLPAGATLVSCEDTANDPGFPESGGAQASLPFGGPDLDHSRRSQLFVGVTRESAKLPSGYAQNPARPRIVNIDRSSASNVSASSSDIT